MNGYTVQFWKNAEQPRKSPPDKSCFIEAESSREAEAKAREHFELPTRYPWACRVENIRIESPAAVPVEPSMTGDGGQAPESTPARGRPRSRPRET